MSKPSLIVAGFDLSSYKFGAARGSYPDRTLDKPIRVEYPDTLTDEFRADRTVNKVISILCEWKPDVVNIEDCRIGFGKKNTGYQDYYGKSNIRIIDYFCKFLAPRNLGKTIEFRLINIKTLKRVCLGRGNATKDEGQRFIEGYYGHPCPTDDHSDAGLLVHYEFLTRANRRG